MITPDSLFYREFREMMNGRKSLSKSFNLVDLPLPTLKNMITGVPNRARGLVRNVKEPFFERLNKQEVELVGRTTLHKRQVLSDGSFQRNKDGKYEYMQVPVPHHCVAILSTVSIGLKRTLNGVEHKPSEGFRYVDYTEQNGERKYIYIVPKEYVYRLNLCALILTPNKRRTFYRGTKLALQNGSYIYLYVVPFTYREQLDVRVIGVKSNFDFKEEIAAVLNYWVGLGVTFHPQATALEEQVNGQTNLGYVSLEGTVVSEDYRRYTISLAEERMENLTSEES